MVRVTYTSCLLNISNDWYRVGKKTLWTVLREDGQTERTKPIKPSKERKNENHRDHTSCQFGTHIQNTKLSNCLILETTSKMWFRPVRTTRSPMLVISLLIQATGTLIRDKLVTFLNGNANFLHDYIISSGEDFFCCFSFICTGGQLDWLKKLTSSRDTTDQFSYDLSRSHQWFYRFISKLL